MASGSISPNLVSGLSLRDARVLLMVLLTTVLGVLLVHVAVHTWIIGRGKTKNGTRSDSKMERTEEVAPVEEARPSRNESQEHTEEDGLPELLNKTVRFLLPTPRVQREQRERERVFKRRNAITVENSADLLRFIREIQTERAEEKERAMLEAESEEKIANYNCQ